MICQTYADGNKAKTSAATTVSNRPRSVVRARIMNASSAQTLPIAVAGQITQFDILYGNLMAGGVFAAVPVVVFALIVQRYIIRGLTLGGVTG